MSDINRDVPESTDDTGSGVVNTILDNLGAVFRHLFPGVLTMCAAHVAYPSWFRSTQFDSWQQLTLAGIIALTVGNVWFVLNRYSFHQAMDWILYLRKVPGPSPKDSRWKCSRDLSEYVHDSLQPSVSRIASQHVKFRYSSVFFLHRRGSWRPFRLET